MVFLHGTATMHMSGIGKTSSERIKQVENRDPTVNDYENYVPVGKSNEKLTKWYKQGAEIVYLTSHIIPSGVEKDKKVLLKYNFPAGMVYKRHPLESYAKVAEKVMPNILIEDDCESIGGITQMTYPHINSEKKKLIKSIVVKEFSGIDGLPDKIKDLLTYHI